MISRGKMATLHFPLLPFDPSVGSYIANALFSGSQVWSLCQQPPASPGNLLEMQNLGSHPRPTE